MHNKYCNALPYSTHTTAKLVSKGFPWVQALNHHGMILNKRFVLDMQC